MQWAGNLILVPEEKVQQIEVSSEDALKFIASAGLLSKKSTLAIKIKACPSWASLNSFNLVSNLLTIREETLHSLSFQCSEHSEIELQFYQHGNDFLDHNNGMYLPHI